MPGAYVDVDRPDILIVEGLNVLQPPRSAPGSISVAVSDYFDFSIYVDADETHIEQWYVDRFLKLRATAFSREDSFFKTYASLTDTEAVSTAHMVWNAINLPNLRETSSPPASAPRSSSPKAPTTASNPSRSARTSPNARPAPAR